MQGLVVFEMMQQGMRYTVRGNRHENSGARYPLGFVGSNILEENIGGDPHETIVFRQKSPAVPPGDHDHQDTDSNTNRDPATVNNFQQVCTQKGAVEKQEERQEQTALPHHFHLMRMTSKYMNEVIAIVAVTAIP